MIQYKTAAKRVKKVPKKMRDTGQFDDRVVLLKKNEEDVKILLENERNSNVKIKKTRDGKHDYMMVRSNKEGDWELVKGLLENLQRVFYWDYNYQQSLKSDIGLGTAEGTYVPTTLGIISDDKKKKRKRRDAEEDLPDPSKRAKYTSPYDKVKAKNKEAKQKGSRLDAELYWYVNSKYKKGKNSTYAKNVVTPSDATRDMIKARREWKWTSLVAQFPIYCQQIKVGTRVDEILIDENNNLIFIDNKRGYENYFTKANGFMKGPLHDVSNAPCNQHFLQVMIEIAMAKYMYGIKNQPRAYIIQVTPSGVIPHKLPLWCTTRLREVWEWFVKNCV